MNNLSEDITPTPNDQELADRTPFTWTNLGKGLVGSCIGGVIEGVGISASSLIRTPRVTYHALKGLWKTKALGPILKTTLTPGVLVGGAAAPVLAVLGGLLFGVVEGFGTGADKSPLQVPGVAIKTIRRYHTEVIDGVVEGIVEVSGRPSDQVFEIRVIEAARGLLGGTFGAIVTALSASFFTVIHTPAAYYKVTRELWRSGQVLPWLVGCQVLVTVAAIIVNPLVLVIGGLGALGIGVFRGYSKGLGVAVRDCFNDVRKYHELLRKMIYHD